MFLRHIHLEKTMRTFALLTVAGLAGSALAHENHATIDTLAGKTLIAVGYYAGEEHFTIDGDGWLLHDDERVTRETFFVWGSGKYAGWQVGAECTLTSDFYAATGRLDGGDFWYELAGFEHVGTPRKADIAWAERHGTSLENVAQFSADTRQGRSFHVGVGGHPHGQQFMVNKPGLYQLTLVAWDANGMYADSDPMHFYVRSLPAPGSLTALGVAALAASRLRR